MKINKIRWKNFTSWGNSWNEFDFDKKPGLSLISGKNGCGKTSISNVIIYMLYGQIDDFTQKDIPNRINKHFEGEIFCSTKNHEIYIYRALSPNEFKVTIDGKSIDTAGKSNIQKWLEDEIYCIPYDIFKNSIVLSVDDFKSFVDLSPKEKRDIIDRIFGYYILNTASSKIKDKLKQVKAEISSCENSINGFDMSIREIDNSISGLKIADNNDVSELKDRFESLKDEMRTYISEYKNVSNDVDDLHNKLNDKTREANSIHTDLNDVKYKMKLYSNGICPTCGASLETDNHIKLKSELQDRERTITESYNCINEQLNSINGKYSEKCKEKQKLMDSISDMKIQYTKYETTIAEYSKSKDVQIKNLLSMKESIENKVSPKKEELIKLNSKNKLLNIVSDIFSESGIKQYISNIYIPLINDYVNDACEKLGISYQITFTTGYDCEITFMGSPVKYKTLSRGERKKVDVAVALAFLKIIKTKISDINILFLDEVLSGIDVSSCNELLKIFSDFSKDTELRIYMVHHANLDSTWIDETIEIEKQNGFSHFVNAL